MRVLAAVGLVGAVAFGCGASNAGALGSIRVKTPKVPTHTVTYSVPSSAMEPTIHCARPAPGCEAAVSDRIAVAEPALDVHRGDVIVFNTPPRAAQVCGSGGVFVKRLIGLPGETWQEKEGYVYLNGKRLNEPYVKNS